MEHKYLSNLPPEDALERYLKRLTGWCYGVEQVKTQDALGRTLARAVYAGICSPHYNASAMDGVALDAACTFGATETTPVTLSEAQYALVDTGDPLPNDCDAVVMAEDVVHGKNGEIRLYAAAVPWQNVRQIGEDISAGDLLLPSFFSLTPAALGALLAGGVLNVAVQKRPVVGIIPTGDEIIAPCEHPQKGDVIEFNSTIFAAMLTQWGAVPIVYPVVKDKRELIAQALKNALGECDIVLLGAGSSAGREDYSASVIAELGEVVVHGVAIKPGKPAILGVCVGKPVLGIPGYPVSGILVLEQFLHPLLAPAMRCLPQEQSMMEAVLGKRVYSSLKYKEFVRVNMGRVGKNIVAVPLNRGAGVVTSFVKADGILVIPQNTEGYEAGERVQIRLLCPPERIQNTLLVIGSHDPLIDELADLLAQSGTGTRIASNHTGSMGAIMAMKRGEAQLGGIHLLDEADGSYNVSYLRRYFPQGGVALVEAVRRQQGLMVAKGNPRNICSFADIAHQGLSFVNRQKGSGTRILTDYTLHNESIAADAIRGYTREEYTHTGVAAQIAANTADAGMGIFAAARIYGLDFVPVLEEQYDLLVTADALESPAVQELLAQMRSLEFRARLETMGGYRLEHPGRVREVL